MSNIAASIITIGDELLIGQVIDTNSAWIAQRLNRMGIDVQRRVAVGDERAAIVHALDEELSKSSLVIITGGLGPTADDITKPLLNEYFGGKMIVDERVLAHLKEMMIRRNRPVLERNMKQAEVPDVCTVLTNKMGSAPGMWFEKDGKVIIALPGVPFEMVSIMEDEGLPRLKERFTSDALLHRSIITAGEGESYIAEKIKDLEEALPTHIRLAYLPGAGMVRLRLTGRGGDAVQLAEELSAAQTAIAARIENIVVALEDIPLEHVLANWFRKEGKTLGLAESCTGGNVAHHLTQIKGASEYFKGSIVCYRNEIKEHVIGVATATIEQHGAISEETVTEMVKGALKVLDVDYAYAVTGILDSDGELYGAPSGTVWMAVADKERVDTKKFYFPFDRLRNKDMATSMGMLMIWKFINNRP